MLDGVVPGALGRRLALCCAAVLVAGCTGPSESDDVRAGPAPGCPASERAAPAEDRPVIDLDLRLDDDLSTVTGTETVTSTPDLAIEELWFRLIPNAPQAATHPPRTSPTTPPRRSGCSRDASGPSPILLGEDSFRLVVHEVAHMWFHGMVGNSAFRDPWLDEVFASSAESVASEPDDVGDDLDIRGDVGGVMPEFDVQDDYERRVHGKGAAAPWSAREAAGREAFDQAVRCYVDARARTITRPRDVARSRRSAVGPRRPRRGRRARSSGRRGGRQVTPARGRAVVERPR